MVFGAYYLTLIKDGMRGEGRVFRHLHEVRHALDAGDVELHAKVTWRRPLNGAHAGDAASEAAEAVGEQTGASDEFDGPDYETVETTPGRIIFNTALPSDFQFVNDIVGKRDHTIGSIVERLASGYPRVAVADSLDKIKELCFRYASQSGLTISMEDVKVPASKADIIARHEADAQKAENQFKRGIITDDERRQKEIEIWTAANSEVGKAMEESLRKIPFNPLDMMVDSGARATPSRCARSPA